MLKPTEKIWHNGRLIGWDDAKIHVLSHVVSYGSSVFEGIRCYATKSGPAIFRLKEHVRRMVDSAKIYRMDKFPYSAEDLAQAMLDVVAINGLPSCYIRPIVLRGYGEVGVNGMKNPIEVYIACWEWGKYLGEEAMAGGVDVCVSSWTRIAPNTLPALAKAGANYMNSQLIKMEAMENGYSEGIALDASGYVSEGSGENMFVVRDGKIDDAAAGCFGAARDHARHDCDDRARSGDSRGGRHHPARDAVHRGRGILLRHGRGSDSDPLDRPHHHRQGRARSRYGAHPARVFRHCGRPDGGSPRLALAGGSA